MSIVLLLTIFNGDNLSLITEMHMLHFVLVHFCFNLYLYLRGGGHNSSLTPPPFNEVCVPSQGSERSCICVLKVSTLTLSTILIFEFGISHFIIRNIYISSFLQMISVEEDYIRR